ncbi:MAG: hypothetical protein AAF617_16905, partial [Bacteroidota bacterium]
MEITYRNTVINNHTAFYTNTLLKSISQIHITFTKPIVHALNFGVCSSTLLFSPEIDNFIVQIKCMRSFLSLFFCFIFSTITIGQHDGDVDYDALAMQ